jgi:hypothetical protein
MNRIPAFKKQYKVKQKEIYKHYSDRADLKEYIEKPVVYFLCRLKRILYVGRTTNIHRRGFCHNKKNYDYIVFIVCDTFEQSCKYESDAIFFFQPALNKRGKTTKIKVANNPEKVAEYPLLK